MNKRIHKVQTAFKANKVDALLISNYYNILYLTGFKTSIPEVHEAYVLITKKDVFLFTDKRYKPAFKKTIYITREKRLTAHLKEQAAKKKVTKLGVEGESLTIAEYQIFSKKLPGLKMVPTTGIVQKLRLIKDQDELEKIRRACHLTDQCLSEIIKTIKAGQTEKEIAYRIETWIRTHNLVPSFEPTVAADQNSAIPHYDTRGGNGVVKKNSLILIDMGIKYKEYCSDITRMFVTGNCTPAVQKAYEILLKVQRMTIQKANKTSKIKEIDLYCRKLIEVGGLKHFVHSTGHGVGLEIHEAPHVSSGSTEKNTAGQVFTIEPGVYYENKFGMRIEDTIAVTEKGVEILTKFPKTLQSIG